MRSLFVNGRAGKRLNQCTNVLNSETAGLEREQPLFFAGSGEELYGVIHHPKGNSRDIGIVVCPPLFAEGMEAHGVLVTLARFLARNGYPVMRFDYRGYGESDGEGSDYTVPDHIDDIRTATERLRAETGVHKTGLLGIRMGATLAILAATRGMPVYLVAALEPVVRGDEYVRELLRLNIAEQMVYRQGVKTGPKKLVDSLRSGETILVAGYPLNQKIYDSLESVDLLGVARSMAVPTLLFSLRNTRTGDDWVRKLHAAMQKTPQGSCFYEIGYPSFWRQTPKLVRRMPELFDAALEWLNTLSMQEAGHRDSRPNTTAAVNETD